MPEGEGRLEVWREAVRRGLSVRETEAAVRRALAPRRDRPRTAEPAAGRGSPMRDMETNLRRALGTRVTVTSNRGGGARIVVDTYSDEELEAVTSKLLSL